MSVGLSAGVLAAYYRDIAAAWRANADDPLRSLEERAEARAMANYYASEADMRTPRAASPIPTEPTEPTEVMK